MWKFLMWITYEISVFGYIIGIAAIRGSVEFDLIINLWLGGWGLLGVIQMAYPIGGLIADIRYGRYTGSLN